MCKIREAGKVRARDRIAVLAALNLAFDLADQHAHPTVTEAPAPVLSSDVAQRLSALQARLDAALNRDDRLL
jgi:cell division protein ZapA